MGLQSSDHSRATPEQIILFENKYNVCYANSILQALFAVPAFEDQMLGLPTLTDPVLTELKYLAQQKKGARTPQQVSPVALLEAIRRQSHMFQKLMHHDAHQFLLYLLNHINEKASAFGLSKEMGRVYQSIQLCQVKCLSCGTTYSREEPSMDLSLPVRPNCSLNHCIKAYLDHEAMEGADQFNCEKCGGLENASRKISFRKLPQILPIHLRRFSFDPKRHELEKLDFHMAFPRRLYLRDEGGQKAYQLQAAVVHLGRGMMLGHYICLARQHDCWLQLNDEGVRQASPRDIHRIYGGQQICAYILIYRVI